MDHVALLLTAIAANISAVGGVVMGIAALKRGSPRERRGAAEGTAERMLKPASVDQHAIEAALVKEARDD